MSTEADGQRAANISLVAGALGLTLLPLVGAGVAIVAGHLARRLLPSSARSRSLATVGLVLGYLGILAPLLLIGIARLFD